MRTPRSMEQVVSEFFARVDKLKGRNACWVWRGGHTDRGYGRVFVNGKTLRAHRFAWVIAHGEISPSVLILHSCDNPPCVRLSHLRLGTFLENMQDKYARGRENQPKGAAHGNAKLTARKVRWLRKTYAVGNQTMQQLGEHLGVSKACVSDVLRNKSWAHVLDNQGKQ